MRAFKIILITIFLCISTRMSAQDSVGSNKGILKLYPLNFVLGNASIGFENILSSRSSVEYLLSYNYYDITSLDKDEKYIKLLMPVNGIGASLSFRYYLSNNDIYNQKIYISPQFTTKFNKGKTIKVEHSYEERRILQINKYAAALLMNGGVQQVSKTLNNHIFDIYFGVGLKFTYFRYNELRVQEYINQDFGVLWKDIPPKGKYTTYGHGPFNLAIIIGVSIGFPLKK